jgi:Mg2+/Co2+ transporter CorB
MVITLIAVFVLLVLSAFFSSSETALTAASRPVMHQLEQNGDNRASLVNQLHRKKEHLIGTILLGNNLVNILASAMTTSLLISLYGETGVVYATIIMTLLVLIFAEILPKTYAFQNADRMALGIAPIIQFLVFILKPFTWTISALINIILKVFGAEYDSASVLGRGDEEIRGAIELHKRKDANVKTERAMLRSVLDLADVQIGEVMIHRKNAMSIDVDLPRDEIIKRVLASPYTRIPLWQKNQDNIVGVLHAKALLRALYGNPERTTSSEDFIKMAADPWFVPETTTLDDQLDAFRQRHEHFALVVDEYGALMGIVTLEDILEEIVGDIADEHDIATQGIHLSADGSYVVDGTVTIRDLNRECEWNLPDEEAATIAGLVLHESRRIPDVGQAYMFHGFRFEILRRQRHQIISIRITPTQEPSESKETADNSAS